MIRCVFATLAILIALSSCTPATQATHPSVISNSATPSPIPTTTQTSLPTQTPTASITPLPTIPTFTPTFDVSTILTVTPAPKAKCPREDLNLVPTFYVPKHPGCFDADQCVFSGTEEEILKFLNKGGTLQSAISRLRTAIYGDYHNYIYQDVTGDNISELMFIDFAATPNLHIFYCKEEMYNVFTLDPETFGAIIQDVRLEPVTDLNANNLPEVIFLTRGCSGSGCFIVFTLEWNDHGFTHLSLQVGIDGLSDFSIQDMDRNGTKEIILKGDYPGTGSYSLMVPWRIRTKAFSWDGQEYALISDDFDSPELRFQAVQDADEYTLEEKYDKALSLYQDTIFSDKLDWWSVEKRNYYVNDLNPWSVDTTPGPPPILDSTEYPRLAAYAYYRIMLVHVVQGNESDAGTVYSTLQEKFGSDPYGSSYVEMATAFWSAYQSTHKIYDGCAAAIQYAAEHPEILVPLGDWYHGVQSKVYKPEDVCPFR